MGVVDRLLLWYEKHGRHDLPWRKTRDPYRVLISELMLQQTQVSRVIPKYEAFLARFPTIETLALAERKDVLLMWQGLGYNSRAVRLHTLAKIVISEHGGKLPETREELLKLPGIGPYTAGAVMIFAHNKPAESVDVNVERVVKRMFWTKRQRPSKREVEQKALEMLSKPHEVHSALMDFGSSICTSTPNCLKCPLHSVCKSQGARSDEKKQKQTPFKHSTRWWRGEILRHVLAGSLTEEELFLRVEGNKEIFQKALEGLEKDGLLRREEKLLLA